MRQVEYLFGLFFPLTFVGSTVPLGLPITTNDLGRPLLSSELTLYPVSVSLARFIARDAGVQPE